MGYFNNSYHGSYTLDDPEIGPHANTSFSPRRQPSWADEQPPRKPSEDEQNVARIAAMPREQRKLLADYWRNKLKEMNDGNRTIYTGELLRVNRELGVCLDAELLALQLETMKIAAE